MNTLYEPLIEAHVKQDYGEFSDAFSRETLFSKYVFSPHEAIYIVDCKSAQMEPLTKNFSKIIGIDQNDKNDLTQLYEHVHPSNLGAFLKFTEQVVQCGFYTRNRLQEETDFIMSLYLTHDQRVILKSTCVLYYDSNDTIRYTLGKLMDVTGLVPFDHFQYKFDGPMSGTLYETLSKNSPNSLLGKREIEVLHLIGNRKSSKEISTRLFISKHTVDKHRRNIIKKLNGKNSFDAFLKAKNLGLL